MKNYLILLFCFTITFSCKNDKKEKPENKTENGEDIISDDYELYKPQDSINAVLVLFGGFPETAEDIKREFDFHEDAKKNNISVLYMNFNQKLWLENDEKLQLASELETIFKAYNLPTKNISIGGFSSGGSVALLISDFLTENKSEVTPKGVFIVDSPVDLAELYHTAKKNIETNFSEPAIQESTWLLQNFEENFGNPDTNISKYEKYSVFTSKTNDIENIKHLIKTKIRLYTEPDILWWRENRMADYEQLNAYHIEKLAETLKISNFDGMDYIETKDRGYRSNGERHPHSWSIVDKKDLTTWMLGE